MGDTVEFLRRREWSMGNGQCPECHGAPLEWVGHPCYAGQDGPSKFGHTAECPWAQMLEDAGERVLRQDTLFPECWQHGVPDDNARLRARRRHEECD